MHLELIELKGIALNKDVYEVMLPTAAGPISVFPGHEPLVSIATPGVITVRYSKSDSDAQLEYYAVSGGVIEITKNHVRVLVDDAEHGEQIIEAETKAALERAIKLRENAKNQVELEQAHQLVDRHTVRLKVAELHRRHRRNR